MKLNHARSGFTMIEAILFLGITGILFVGIAAATQTSIYQQRYTDSVENFAEFLRSVYSQVPNVQSENTGRSDQAIYGKLVTFNVKNNGSGDRRNDIKTYNLIGDIKETNETAADEDYLNTCGTDLSNILVRLCRLKASVVAEKESATGVKTYNTVGFVEDYVMRWSAGLQTKAPSDLSPGDNPRDFIGILVITHSPDSGNVFTYFMGPDTADRNYINPDDSSTNFNGYDYRDRKTTIQQIISKIEQQPQTDTRALYCPNAGGTLTHCFSSTFNYFDGKDIDFCVNPGGLDAKIDLRRNIRITGGNHNASGVQVVTDEPYSDTFKEGNRCKS